MSEPDGEAMPLLRRVGVPLVGTLAVLAVAGLLLQRFFADPEFLPPDDFLQYYAGGRLLVTGGDPYDADQLLPIQQTAGRPAGMAVMMWNPPWALTLAAPFGQLPPKLAQLVWLAAQMVAVAGCAVALWRLYGGPARLVPVVIVVALVFPPVNYVVTAGQSGGWLLLGVSGLALAGGTGRPWLAALAALAAIKPHLFIPVWITLALDATRSPLSRRLLGWGVAAGLTMTLVPLLFDSHVWGNYLRALGRPEDDRHPPLSGWRNPLIGFYVRESIDISKFWIQMVPTAVLVALTPVYWWTRRHCWDWPDQLPVLILAGLVAAPYGAWVYDLTVLLVPLAAVTPGLVRDGWTARTVGLAAGAVIWCVAGYCFRTGEYFVWMTPTAIIGYWIATRRPRGV